MIDVVRGMSDQPTVSITKRSLGFLDEDFQRDKINSYLAQRFSKGAEVLRLDNDSDLDVADVLDFVVSSHATKLVIWNLLVLSPVIYDAEDLLFFLAELEKRFVDLVIIENDLLILSRAGASFTLVRSLWDGFKLARKRENALASRAKAKSSGNAVLRKRRVHPAEVSLLRSQGYKIREIAERVNVSESAVYRALNEAELCTKKTSQ